MAEKTAASLLARPAWLRIVAVAAGLILLTWTVIGIYWSREPDVFWVNHQIEDQRVVVGYSTTDTLIRVAETLLEKPGAYLTNDVKTTRVLLVNFPSWELCVLTQVRDRARVI
ncbi:MAG: DUF2333 family protein, partial [Woeseiaceae bacterium]|nr:DUF2333 family protein [Woeseiaceae bacterium]